MDVNCVVVQGRERCLLVDTGSTAGEGQRLRTAALEIAAGRELVVVNTHAHYDHCFGNSAFEGTPIWASAGCARDLLETGARQRELAAAGWEPKDPEFARALAAAPLALPTNEVEGRARLELGGLSVELEAVGRGHTDHDLVAFLPQLRVLIAGDLVEESGPPALEDCWPFSWPRVLRRLLDWEPLTIVPGHGRVVGPEFVRRQLGELEELAAWCLASLDTPRGGRGPALWSEAELRSALARAAVERASTG